MAFNEERYMKSLSKKSGIYGFAGQATGLGTKFDYDKFGESMFKVMNSVKWDTRTSFQDIVKTQRATTF